MRKYLYVLIAVWLSSIGPLSLAQSSVDDTDMVYRYWDWELSEQRDNYQYDLLKASLEATRAEYGSYQLQRVRLSLSTSRARREIARGNLINVHVGPLRPMEPNNNFSSIRVDVPIFNNLFGWRRLIVTQKNIHKFDGVLSEEQFKLLIAGQARNWVDVRIYRANGYGVNDDANSSNLFASE
jgi:hypothetical protein